ncbi:hypothetical protein ACQP00_28505 [Dactylosporangium sp. CS-047395]|uniref:hypothetical protein n=1 Tax=Dactylosporangium sp. CS-047395 TaxID=3239936 RepID=UPI003D8DD0FF
MPESTLDDLVAVALDSPGPAAARSAVTVLTAMAGDGHHDATVALGRVLAGELGRSCPDEAWHAKDAAGVLHAALPPLVKIFILGHEARYFVDNLDAIRSPDVGADALRLLQQTVRRGAPIQDAVLTAVLLAGFAGFAAGPVTAELSPNVRLRMLRTVIETARVIPG